MVLQKDVQVFRESKKGAYQNHSGNLLYILSDRKLYRLEIHFLIKNNVFFIKSISFEFLNFLTFSSEKSLLIHLLIFLSFSGKCNSRAKEMYDIRY